MKSYVKNTFLVFSDGEEEGNDVNKRSYSDSEVYSCTGTDTSTTSRSRCTPKPAASESSQISEEQEAEIGALELSTRRSLDLDAPSFYNDDDDVAPPPFSYASAFEQQQGSGGFAVRCSKPGCVGPCIAFARGQCEEGDSCMHCHLLHNVPKRQRLGKRKRTQLRRMVDGSSAASSAADFQEVAEGETRVARAYLAKIAGAKSRIDQTKANAEEVVLGSSTRLCL